jgi:hypothetical protein
MVLCSSCDAVPLKVKKKNGQTSSLPATDYFSLTLIRLGEVKFDLAEFDLKLQENLLSTFIFKIPILTETSSGSF